MNTEWKISDSNNNDNAISITSKIANFVFKQKIDHQIQISVLFDLSLPQI